MNHLHKCTIGKNGGKYYFKKVKGKWKRVSNRSGINALNKNKFNERITEKTKVERIPLSRYSLWGVPKKNSKVYIKLLKEINYLSELYDLPKFKPHITITSGIQLDPDMNLNKSMKQLMEKVKKYKIEMNKVSSGVRWNQSVFILSNKTRSVMNANRVSEKIFDVKHPAGYKGKYMPHVSLIYGSINSKKKREIINYFNRKFKNINNLDFDVDEIQLWNTTGGFKGLYNWKKIKSIKLK